MTSRGKDYEDDSEYGQLVDNLEYCKFLIIHIDSGQVDDQLFENIFELLTLLRKKFEIYKDNILFDGDNEIYIDYCDEIKKTLNYINIHFIKFDEGLQELEHNGYIDSNSMLETLRDLLEIATIIQNKMLRCTDLCAIHNEDPLSDIFKEINLS